ncbi:hypothetical protein PIB30_065417 [Stylosanthes scabra]|uniref:Uncharacterized protein n=1 Tax=Stylosanthes scabra TaxID=79078 RepID=A0ABU6ZKR2_9FABA|nr:hypothetical protein [Stylosanthes scabra]
MRLYLEDEQKNKMTCTLFGDYVVEALGNLQKPSLYGSGIFFNPLFLDVVELRNRKPHDGYQLLLCLLKDSDSQSNPEISVETLTKVVGNDSRINRGVDGVMSPKDQDSNSKIFRRCEWKRKMD